MIVVTGGLGFIGSHVVDAYLAQGKTDHRRLLHSRQRRRGVDAHPADRAAQVPRSTCPRSRPSQEPSASSRCAHVGRRGSQAAGRIGTDIVPTPSWCQACTPPSADVHLLLREVSGRRGCSREGRTPRPHRLHARIEYAIAQTERGDDGEQPPERAARHSHRPLTWTARAIAIGRLRDATSCSRAGGPAAAVSPAAPGRASAASDLALFPTDHWTPARRARRDLHSQPAQRHTIWDLAERVVECWAAPRRW